MNLEGHDKKRLVKVSIVVFVIFSLCASCYQLFANNCLWWNCAPERDFTVYDLNLPDEYFPKDAYIQDLHEDRSDFGPREAAVLTNHWSSGVAIYLVQRFATDSQASTRVANQVNIKVIKNVMEHQGQYSMILDYKSEYADEYYVECGYTGTNDFRCRLDARYQEFYIYFSGSLGEGEMSKEDFLGVMTYIDERINTLLSGEE
jgi:hypothetical protein